MAYLFQISVCFLFGSSSEKKVKKCMQLFVKLQMCPFKLCESLESDLSDSSLGFSCDSAKHKLETFLDGCCFKTVVTLQPLAQLSTALTFVFTLQLVCARHGADKTRTMTRRMMTRTRTSTSPLQSMADKHCHIGFVVCHISPWA